MILAMINELRDDTLIGFYMRCNRTEYRRCMFWPLLECSVQHPSADDALIQFFEYFRMCW